MSDAITIITDDNNLCRVMFNGKELPYVTSVKFDRHRETIPHGMAGAIQSYRYGPVEVTATLTFGHVIIERATDEHVIVEHATDGDPPGGVAMLPPVVLPA